MKKALSLLSTVMITLPSLSLAQNQAYQWVPVSDVQMSRIDYACTKVYNEMGSSAFMGMAGTGLIAMPFLLNATAPGGGQFGQGPTLLGVGGTFVLMAAPGVISQIWGMFSPSEIPELIRQIQSSEDGLLVRKLDQIVGDYKIDKRDFLATLNKVALNDDLCTGRMGEDQISGRYVGDEDPETAKGRSGKAANAYSMKDIAAGVKAEQGVHIQKLRIEERQKLSEAEAAERAEKLRQVDEQIKK